MMKQKHALQITFLYETLEGKWGFKTITINLEEKYKNRKKFSTRQLNQLIKEQLNLKTVCISNITHIYKNT